jgi:hypothetical protein
MNVEKAIEFVRSNGSRFEQARLNHILGLEYDRDEVIKGFASIQNPDGGFPYGDKPGFPSCMSNTTMALQTLVEMGLEATEPGLRGLDFLMKSKGKGGTWEENPKVKPLDPPFWDLPGDEDTTTWLTVAVADILQRTGNRVPKATLRYLAERQGPDGRFRGFHNTTWIALPVFRGKGQGDRAIWSGALKSLESADTEDWDVPSITWCLDSMKRGGVDRSSPLWNKLVDALMDMQEADGSWPSDGGPGMKIRDTNSALNVLMDLMEYE